MFKSTKQNVQISITKCSNLRLEKKSKKKFNNPKKEKNISKRKKIFS